MVEYRFLKAGKKEHIETLHREGLLYLNTWDYFKKDTSNPERGDPYEGTTQSLKTNAIPQTKENGNWHTLGKITQIRKDAEDRDDYNLFCLYTIYYPKLDQDNFLIIDERFKTLGEYFLFILDGNEFINRVKKVLSQKEIPHNSGLVNYLDVSKHNGELDAFTKDIRFSYQNEYRFFVHTKQKKECIFSIGDISDISIIIPSDKLSKSIRVTY